MSQQYFYSSLTGPQIDAALLQISQAADYAANAAASAAAAQNSAQAAEAFASQANGYSETESDCRFAPGIRVTAEGSRISVTDGADAGALGLRIFGTSPQNGSPSPESPVYPSPLQTAVTNGSTGEQIQLPALRGIPVTLTHSNEQATYTDETGHKWLADEVDPVRGVHIIRCFTVMLDGSEEWLFNSDKGGFDLSAVYYSPLYDLNYDTSFSEAFHICSHFRAVGYYEATDNTVVSCGTANGYTLRFFHSASNGDPESWKAFLKAQYDAGTPVSLVLCSRNPRQEPATVSLTPRGPEFALSNSHGAHMALTYVADTKTYIDQKLAAISAAIL